MSGDRAGKPVRGRTGALRVVWALRYSLRGIGAALRFEAAFRQECALALVLIPVAVWLPAASTQKVLLIASVLVVLVVELLNSAVEAAVDHHCEEPHPLAARAKDLGSAAVLLSMVVCVVVWGVILFGLHEQGAL